MGVEEPMQLPPAALSEVGGEQAEEPVRRLPFTREGDGMSYQLPY